MPDCKNAVKFYRTSVIEYLLDPLNLMDNEKKIKLLQLRKYRTTFGFMSHYEGPLFTKGGIKSKGSADKIKSDFQKDADNFHWKAPPKARIALSFNIFCNQKNPPEIYRIVKYYLDLLQGPVFNNDKQVHFLEASIWRSDSDDLKSGIYIQARRLIELYKIWDIYQEENEYQHEHNEEVLFPYPHLIDQSLWDIADQQYDLLKNGKISPYDRPGLRQHISPTMMGRFCGIDPMIFDIGHLPSKDESKVFKAKVNDLFSEYGNKYPFLKKIYVPIEIDLQVTKTGKEHFTDLDNTVAQICKELRKTILYEKVYINGFRAYVVDEVASGIKADLRLKLLPAGEIESYNERMKKTLSHFEKNIEDEIWV
ncbi:MAG: hypothetical protein ABSE63_00220 [Thermoguttaceae bacterium]|jgi:hypothetical protein